MRYDLLDLRLFRQVVAEGSLTAGAERVHLSLPSASARVRALEAHAGLARLEGAVAAYRRSPTTPLVLLAGSSAMRRLVPAPW